MKRVYIVIYMRGDKLHQHALATIITDDYCTDDQLIEWYCKEYGFAKEDISLNGPYGSTIEKLREQPKKFS